MAKKNVGLGEFFRRAVNEKLKQDLGTDEDIIKVQFEHGGARHGHNYVPPEEDEKEEYKRVTIMVRAEDYQRLMEII